MSFFYNLTLARNKEINEVFDVADQLRTFNKVSQVFTPVIISVLLLVGLLGNSLVIYVSVSTQRIIRHPLHSILVLNLAVADIIYLLVSAPYQQSMENEGAQFYIVEAVFILLLSIAPLMQSLIVWVGDFDYLQNERAVYFTVPSWIYGKFLCPALHYFSTLTMAVSIFTMCSLALMRFIAIMMPFKVKTSFITASGKLTGSLIIGMVWILASFLALPNIIYFELKNVFPNQANATKAILECRWDDVTANKVNILLLLVVTYVIPFLLVTVLYVLVGREVLCYMRKKTVNLAGKQNERKEYVKTTAMVLCLIIAFLVCWFPHHLYSMIMVSQIYKDRSYAVKRTIMKLVGLCFSYAHACVNPFIYTFAAPGFRRSLFKTSNTGPISQIYIKTLQKNKTTTKYSTGRSISPNNIRNKVLEKSTTDQEISTTMFSKFAMSIRREVSSSGSKKVEKKAEPQTTKKEKQASG